tara:strand:- start:6338 stop:7783 length:1446 start_codon:yes stop_codon:yes gene_type:complete
MKKIQNYINGKLISPNSNSYINNYDPSNGKIYSLIPNSNEKDVDIAVKAAKKAFISWSKSNKEVRMNFLIAMADEIEKQKLKFIKAESRDNGKPEWLAEKVDIPRSSANLKFFARAILHYGSEFHETNESVMNYTLKQPIGVAGCISPWNLPLYLFTWKIAPALATGNTVVAKPSELTPMTAYMLSKICIKIGLPKGVLNIVHGYGNIVGEAITKHDDVSIISFTGGTETGKKIAKNTSTLFKKTSLELGGKNPNIIFKDANINLALEYTIKASFLNQGQICLCGSRIFIQKKIYNKFKKLLIKKASALKVGDPKEKNNFLGAVVSKNHMEKILKKIKTAKKEGGKVLLGGTRKFLKGDLKNGYYINPTIIENLDNNSSINQEEIFGPVVTLMPFEDEKEVVKYANATKYGLSASIFTQDIDKAHRVSKKIDCGIIWINSWMIRDLRIPFGGMKQSGLGREGGFRSLDFFTETKNVCLKLN